MVKVMNSFSVSENPNSTNWSAFGLHSVFNYLALFDEEDGILYEGIGTTLGDYYIESKLSEEELADVALVIKEKEGEARKMAKEYLQHGEKYLKERVNESSKAQWRGSRVRCF